MDFCRIFAIGKHDEFVGVRANCLCGRAPICDGFAHRERQRRELEIRRKLSYRDAELRARKRAAIEIKRENDDESRDEIFRGPDDGLD